MGMDPIWWMWVKVVLYHNYQTSKILFVSYDYSQSLKVYMTTFGSFLLKGDVFSIAPDDGFLSFALVKGLGTK